MLMRRTKCVSFHVLRFERGGYAAQRTSTLRFNRPLYRNDRWPGSDGNPSLPQALKSELNVLQTASGAVERTLSG